MPITCPIKFVPLSKSDFGKLDYSVMPFAFSYHTELGRLANESVYQSDFSKRLSKAGFDVRREIPVTAAYQTFDKTYYLDFYP